MLKLLQLLQTLKILLQVLCGHHGSKNLVPHKLVLAVLCDIFVTRKKLVFLFY